MLKIKEKEYQYPIYLKTFKLFTFCSKVDVHVTDKWATRGHTAALVVHDVQRKVRVETSHITITVI